MRARTTSARGAGIALATQGLAFAPEDTAAEQLGKLEVRLGALASTETPELPRVLAGMSDAYYAKGDLATAAEVAQEALAAAERTGDAFDLLAAHHSVGGPLLFQGSFSQALQHFEHSVKLYNPREHGSLAYTVGHDCGVCAHGFAALCHVYLGHPDRALAMSEAAVALAKRVEHPLTLANALFQGGVVHLQRGELDRTREHAEELVGLCERLGFPLYLGMGRFLRGWARVESGEGDAGLAEMQQAMVELAGIGSGMGAPEGLFAPAKGFRKVGRHDDALGALGLGVAQAEQQGEPSSMPSCTGCGPRFSSTQTAMQSRRRRRSSANLSRSPGGKRPRRSSCAPPPAWRGSGSARASATPPAPSSPRSTPGSPKASPRATCRTRRRCWRSCSATCDTLLMPQQCRDTLAL